MRNVAYIYIYYRRVAGFRERDVRMYLRTQFARRENEKATSSATHLKTDVIRTPVY